MVIWLFLILFIPPYILESASQFTHKQYTCLDFKWEYTEAIDCGIFLYCMFQYDLKNNKNVICKNSNQKT
jgi:hypothetical protein